MPRPIIVAYAPDTTARPPPLPSSASELLSLLVAGVQQIAHNAQPQGVEHWSSDEFIGSRPDVNGLIATALLKPLHEHVGSKPREAGKDSERDNPEVLELPAEKRWQDVEYVKALGRMGEVEGKALILHLLTSGLRRCGSTPSLPPRRS